MDQSTGNSAELSKDDLFRNEIASVINRFSMENRSNTPDFILAEYLSRCLDAFDLASKGREQWYGKSLSIGNSITETPDQDELRKVQ